MRQFLGSTIIAVVGIAVSVVGIWQDLPRPALVAVIAFTALGVLLTWPSRQRPPTAFFRGNAARFTARDSYSDADFFIDGDALDTDVDGIRHSPRGRRR